ncbi:MAG: DUF4491 family protein [Anaerolineales bacterium]|jgi:hypothetical protein
MNLNLQWVGVLAAAATFLGVWFGHVAVRKIEARVEKLWVPIMGTLLLGLAFETWSLLTDSLLASAVAGVLGITLLWDSFEFWRQQKRVIKGHAPANPDNLRHARIFAENKDATILDLLDRDPIGYPVSAEDAIRLVSKKPINEDGP